MATNAYTISDSSKEHHEFLNRLYREFDKGRDNVLFSPLNLNIVLSLLYQGAEGVTKQILESSLSIPDKAKSADECANLLNHLKNSPRTDLSITNKMYISNNCKIKDSFKNKAYNKFSAGVEHVNSDDKTYKEEFLEPGDNGMVFVGTIYCKGEWNIKFEKSNTKKGIFQVSKTNKVYCNMMRLVDNFMYKNDDELDAEVLKMSYKNKDFYMIIILPSAKNGVTGLESKMKNYDLTKLTRKMSMCPVALSIPKFKIEATVELNKPLMKVGLENIFSKKPQFGEMVETTRLFKIKSIVQKVLIEVNETGTDVITDNDETENFGDGCWSPRKEFTADRPFKFYLFAKGHLLFSGRIMDPEY